MQKSFDGVTDTYGYTDSAWGDLLTSYNGVAITYDAIGNPLSYYNGEQYAFTWQNGRQLATATFGGKQMSFEYNEAGMRTAKTVGELRTEYVYDGALLLRETQKDADGNVVYTISFTYDEAGRPFSATFAGETYYYVYDVYGNVSVIYTSAGERVIRYTYPDPWGYEIANRVTGTAARAFNNVNPYKYKGYYCDADLDLYYCGSRYYDGYTCRWINADGYVSTGQGILGNNMFAYCGNNPVMRMDPTGRCWAVVVGIVVVIANVVKKALSIIEDILFIHETEVHYTVDLAICTDGAPSDKISKTGEPGKIHDECYQERTSLGHYASETYLNALEVNYIVLPKGYTGFGGIGNIGKVVDLETGRQVWCIVGETGTPGNSVTEVSIHAVWDVGYPNHNSGMYGVDGHFNIIIYPNVYIDLDWNSPIQPQIDAMGRTMLW